MSSQGRLRSVWLVRAILATSLFLAAGLIGFFTFESLRAADEARFSRLYNTGVDQLQSVLEMNYKAKAAAVTAVAAAFAYPTRTEWVVATQFEVRQNPDIVDKIASCPGLMN